MASMVVAAGDSTSTARNRRDDANSTSASAREAGGVAITATSLARASSASVSTGHSSAPARAAALGETGDKALTPARATPRAARTASAWRVAARPAPTMPTDVIGEWSHNLRRQEGLPGKKRSHTSSMPADD